jgi:hypothetical protein
MRWRRTEKAMMAGCLKRNSSGQQWHSTDRGNEEKGAGARGKSQSKR